MSEMNNERFEDLKEAYVLGALPEEERQSFEDYLAGHPERQAEIDELGAVAGLLAFSPPEQEPSPEIRSRVMEVVDAEVASIDKNQVILVANNMPSVPEDRTCQIWVIKGDVPKPSGLFRPDGNMTATPITNSIEKADVIAVTVEPAGGSEQPTSDPVLSAEL